VLAAGAAGLSCSPVCAGLCVFFAVGALGAAIRAAAVAASGAGACEDAVGSGAERVAECSGLEWACVCALRLMATAGTA
jgi:hypothetical protein